MADEELKGRIADLTSEVRKIGETMGEVKTSMAVVTALEGQRSTKLAEIETRTRTLETDMQQVKVSGSFAGGGLKWVFGIVGALAVAAIVALVTKLFR